MKVLLQIVPDIQKFSLNLQTISNVYIKIMMNEIQENPQSYDCS